MRFGGVYTRQKFEHAGGLDSRVSAWQVGADWRSDPDLHTYVEVTYTPVAEDETRVELRHHGEVGPVAAAAMTAMAAAIRRAPARS